MSVSDEDFSKEATHWWYFEFTISYYYFLNEPSKYFLKIAQPVLYS